MAKVLTSSLYLVMDKMISHDQSTFIKGRHLVDGVVSVNELVNLVKNTKKACLIFKVR